MVRGKTPLAKSLENLKKAWRKKGQDREVRIVRKIRETAKEEELKRRRKDLSERLKEKWDKFIAERKTEKKIRKRGKEIKTERNKTISKVENFFD